MLRFLLARFRERSTWVGLLTLLVTLGAPLVPELQAALADFGPALIGLLLVLLPDAPPPPIGATLDPDDAPLPDRLRRDAPDGLSTPEPAPGASGKPDPWGWQRTD